MFPAEKFYVNFSIATLTLMKEHGDHLDFKDLFQSTPQLKTYTTSVARKIAAHDHQLRYVVYNKAEALDYAGGILSATEVCHMRSGLEFVSNAFEDVPVLNSRRRRIDPLKERYDRIENLDLPLFDNALKTWASTYQFLEDDVIPTNIPLDHWWWEMTAQDKPKEVFDFLSYKHI